MNAQTQKPAAGEMPEWMLRKERGNAFWLRVMRRISLTLGRPLSRPVVYGIALYFLLTAPAARKASRSYLARCLGRPATWFDLYRHILAFSSTIHDRIYLLNDRHDLFSIRVFGTEALYALQASNRGLLMFGAHLGSFEVLRTIARDNPRLKVYMAMYPENARRINGMLAAINPLAAQDIIALGSIDAILEIQRRLEEGALVGVLVDRATGPGQYIGIPFLGTEALFPSGPFRMAALLAHPVFFMVGLYRGGNRYDVHFELLSDFAQAATGGRDAAVREVLARYVTALERHSRSAPFNWFNFYEFWESARCDPA